MGRTLIYLIGFPGSSKFTTAKELCKIISAVIVSNNLFNNIEFDIVKLQDAEVPDDLWEKIFAVRENILAILEKHYVKSKHYIFTNELIEGDLYDQRLYNLVVNLSKKIFIPEGSLEIDNLNLSAKEIAKKIVEEMKKEKNGKLIKTSVINHLKIESTRG